MSADRNVLILPVWKKDASAEEWFYDMAMLARKHPERFKRCVLVYEEMSADNASSLTDYYPHGCSTTEVMGILELGKMRVYERTHR